MDGAFIRDLYLPHPAKPTIIMTIQRLHCTSILKVSVLLIILLIEDLILVPQGPGVVLVPLEIDLMLEVLLELEDGRLMEGDCTVGGL